MFQLSLGKHDKLRETKVILMVGATGTGKTTLINAMVNFIFRIEFSDGFRLILIDDKDAPKRSQAESQTDLITAYVFNYMPGMPFNYNYVLIDTPGFGDTRGIKRDREMMSQLETFLKQDYGVDQVDGVGFVTPASAARLTQTQRYVFDGLSSMFGKDIKDNIYVMATFADAKDPPVLAALKEAEVHYKGFYKFNNSAIYAGNDVIKKEDSDSDEDSDDDDDEDSSYICKLFWEMGFRSLHNFFIKLGKTTPASLTLTKDVLEERRKLQTVVIGLQNQIQVGLAKLANLHQERDMLGRVMCDVEGCKDYEEEVDVPEIKQINLNPNECVTNCTKCNYTCHYPCYLPKNSDKEGCAAMSGGMCRVCPGNCHWNVHHNMDFRFETFWKKEKRTVQELFDRYNLAIQDQDDKAQIIKRIETDIEDFGKNLVSIIKEAQGHVEKLEQIALKPNPISTKEYIELLIESEKMQKRPNFEKRIQMLELLKTEVLVLSGLKGSKSAMKRGGESLLQHFQNMFIQ